MMRLRKLPGNERTIHILLAFLVVFDLILVVWAFFFPDLWFAVFHETMTGSPEGLLLLKRVGANWAGFMVIQAIAWKHWKAQPVWLAVVAGVRLSDVFTDAIYALFATDPTWFNVVSLPPMGLINLALGWFFLTSYFRRRERATA